MHNPLPVHTRAPPPQATPSSTDHAEKCECSLHRGSYRVSTGRYSGNREKLSGLDLGQSCPVPWPQRTVAPFQLGPPGRVTLHTAPQRSNASTTGWWLQSHPDVRTKTPNTGRAVSKAPSVLRSMPCVCSLRTLTARVHIQTQTGLRWLLGTTGRIHDATGPTGHGGSIPRRPREGRAQQPPTCPRAPHGPTLPMPCGSASLSTAGPATAWLSLPCQPRSRATQSSPSDRACLPPASP